MLKKPKQKTGELGRGRSLITNTVMAFVAVLLGSVSVTIWTGMQQQRHAREVLNSNRIQALGGVLAKSAETLLVNNELSALRRLISETGVEHQLDVCQLVLPDEGVAAAAEPSHISVVALPEQWTEDPGLSFEESVTDGYVTMRFPVQVPDRGSALLEISAPVEATAADRSAIQLIQMVSAGLALGAILLVYHRAHPRFQAMGTVYETLMAVQEGQTDMASLQLDSQLGPEAEAWNTLLGEKKRQQVCAALDQVKQNIHARGEVSDDLARACDALPIGMVLLDKDDRTLYVNGAAAVFLRTTPDALRQTSLSECVDDTRVQEAVTEVIGEGSIPRRIIEIGADRDHQSGVLRFTVRPIHTEGGVLALVLVEDVTQQRVAVAARDSFLAQATHELRSPLTSIRLYIEKAIEDTETSPDEVAQSLNVVNEESRRLERVVSEILSVSEIEAGSFHLERDDVHLDRLLEQLQAEHKPQAQEKNINLVFDVSPKLPVLQADRDKIAVALHNLVGNAVKYTNEGGTVTVRADVEDGQLCVEITDTGLGIKDEDQERIFEKFYRAKDRRVASITGSGLGLAISREVIRLHGGDITVESTYNKGSIFTLSLPIPQEVVEGGYTDSTVRSG